MNDRIFAFMFIVIAFFVLGFTISRAVFKSPEPKKEIVSAPSVEEISEESLQATAAVTDAIPPNDELDKKIEATSTQADLTPSKKEAEKDRGIVTIQSTPTGWLNVREGPATTYKQVKKINPGETYKFLEEKSGWYKIKLDEATDGWIASQYAKKSD